jgi:hypothetical protein
MPVPWAYVPRKLTLVPREVVESMQSEARNRRVPQPKVPSLDLVSMKPRLKRKQAALETQPAAQSKAGAVVSSDANFWNPEYWYFNVMDDGTKRYFFWQDDAWMKMCIGLKCFKRNVYLNILVYIP